MVCNECHNTPIPKHNASNARPSVKIKGRRIIMNTFNKKIVVTFSFFGKGVVRAKAHTELEACFPVADAIQRGRRRARVALKRELEKEREWINSPQRVWNW